MVHLQRASLLLQQNRHKEAEKEIRQALANDPQNAEAYMLLAECSIRDENKEKAIEYAKQAVGLDSDNPFTFSVLSKCYWIADDLKMADQAIDESIRIYPSHGDFYLLKGHIAYGQRNWEKTLLLAEKSLELNSESVQAINLRSMALVKLNRQDEASEGLDFALNKNPENPYSHASKGWAMLEKEDYDAAFKHFREALRLDPNNEFARSGLLQAIKAKNPVYRLILRYFLWMDKLSRQNQWAFIIGVYVLYRITLAIADSNPALAPYLYPLIVLYIVFAFSTWIATTVSNLAIQLHPLGKYALTKDERLGANITGGLLFGAVGSLIMYFVSGSNAFWMILTGFFALLLIPVGGTFAKPAKSRGRKILTAYTIGLVVAGLIGILYAPLFESMFYIFVFGIFIFSFASGMVR